MGYKLKYTKQAEKDARLLEQAGLDKVAVMYIEEVTPQEKSKKAFRDIAKPLVHTRNWKFDRKEANERR